VGGEAGGTDFVVSCPCRSAADTSTPAAMPAKIKEC